MTSGPDCDSYTVERDYHALGTASVVGRFHADDFGATLFDGLRAGHTLTVADVATDPRLTRPPNDSATGISTSPHSPAFC